MNVYCIAFANECYSVQCKFISNMVVKRWSLHFFILLIFFIFILTTFNPNWKTSCHARMLIFRVHAEEKVDCLFIITCVYARICSDIFCTFKKQVESIMLFCRTRSTIRLAADCHVRTSSFYWFPMVDKTGAESFEPSQTIADSQ